MNCFILLLLLSCCGWGSSCGDNRSGSGCGCGSNRNRSDGRMGHNRSGRNGNGCGCSGNMERSGDGCGCGGNMERGGCGCDGNMDHSGNGCGCDSNMDRSGNGCDCDSNMGRGGNGCGCDDNIERGGCGCGTGNMNEGCPDGRNSDRRDSFRGDRFGSPDGCECGGQRRDNEHSGFQGRGIMDRENDGCDGPGMIPPPWQEYPRFPRRDNGEECDS